MPRNSAQLPRDELFLADAVQLTGRLLARRHAMIWFEDIFGDFIESGGAVDDPAKTQVHVAGHALEHRRLGPQLDRGAGLDAQTDPPPFVKQTTVAPPATIPVAQTGSYPGRP